MNYKVICPKAAQRARTVLVSEQKKVYRYYYECWKLQGSSKASNLARMKLTRVFPERYRELYNQFKEELAQQEATQ